MNRNLDGSHLTDEQLLGWAVKGGANEEDLQNKMADAHNDNLNRSLLLKASATARYRAFCKGELNLDTRK